MIRPTARRLRGNALIAANLRGQRRIPFAPRERLEAMRDRRIRRIVAYAARSVPYYRETFAREGIDPREIRRAGDLDRLGVLDRELVRAQPGAGRPRSSPDHGARPIGKPVAMRAVP